MQRRNDVPKETPVERVPHEQKENSLHEVKQPPIRSTALTTWVKTRREK